MTVLSKDLFREIKKSFGRFLSIFSIVAIGVAFFVGVQGSAPIMKYSADRYFDDSNLMDIRLLSTWGFTEEDITKIRETDGVLGVYPTYTMDVLTSKDATQMVLKLYGLPLGKMDKENPDYINQVILVDGRLPEASGECVIESTALFANRLQIGDVIVLESGTETDLSESLKQTEYTVVGSVQTSYYLSFEKGSSNIGDGDVYSYLFLPESDFIGERYTEVYLTVDGAKAENSYTEAYFSLTDPVKSELTALGFTRSEEQLTEQKTLLWEELAEQQALYEENKATFNEELKRGQAELEEGRFALLKAEVTLESQRTLFETQTAQAQAELDAAEETLRITEETYQTNYENYQSVLTYGQNALTRLNTVLASLEAQLEALQVQLKTVADVIELQQLQERIAQVQADIDSTQAQIPVLQTMVDQTAKQLEDAKAELEAGKAELERQKERFATETAQAQAALEEAEAQYQQAKAELEAGEVTLEEQTAEGAVALAEAELALLDAQSQIETLEGPEWYVLDRNSHYSYVDYGDAADRMAGIAKLFPVIFLLVAVLVCLTTMTRMVDEQRSTIGTLKALGYSTRRIAGKYVTYAALASISGSIIGCVVGMMTFPTIIYNTWRIIYVMPDVTLLWQPWLLVATILVAVLTTTLAAFAACYKELVETPALLMRPKAPKMGKKIFLEQIPFFWKHLSFSKKVTARNIFRYKKRFFMTIIGIMGCTALLLSGFGISDSIRYLVDLQYGEIYQYDGVISYAPELALDEKKDFMTLLEKNDQVESAYAVGQYAGTLYTADSTGDFTAIVVDNPARFSAFTTLRKMLTKETLNLTSSGVIVTEKFALNFHLSAGDTISIAVGDNSPSEVQIAGITEHYVGHYIYMTETCYRTLYREMPEQNLILFKTGSMEGDAQSAFAAELMECAEVSSVSFYSGTSESFQDMVSSLSIITLVLIISAGILAFVVLYNLTNVNISERLREIATIKVLGFYDREVATYVFRENILLTVIGAFLGLFAGVGLHQMIISMAEMEMVMFGRSILPISYVYSFLLTMAFSLIVSWVMRPKLQKIPMVESLKSVE